MTATAAAPEHTAGVATAADSEEYLGMVKSYNARRGFGFIACEATAAKFGRDVYIAKAEVQLIAAAGGLPYHPLPPPCRPGEKPALPALEEEDLVRFSVRLSGEGYPQAEHIRCVQKFQGVIMDAPGEAATDEEATPGRILSDELLAARGAREAIIRRSSCGRAMLSAGDRVTFCVQDAEGGAIQGRREAPEALLVMLMPRHPHMGQGGIIGCCVLSLPRSPAPGGWGGYRPDLQLDCHALSERIILSGLPQDASQDELMRFFSKHGAAQVNVAASRNGAFASVAFQGTSEVARFMARSAHTFADDKETRLARLLPRCSSACARSHQQGSGARLPGLPQPTVTPGPEAGVLVVQWSPVVLATGYSVELRPAGVQANWSVVDASDGRLGADGGVASGAGRFGRDCSSCRVGGLPSNVVFEARVTYVTSCGCVSDASDASDWCLAYPQAAPQANPMTAAPQFAMPGAGAMGMPTPGMGAAGAMAWPGQMPPQMGCAGWRCMHGMVLTPPGVPEIRAADEYGFSLLVQWLPAAGSVAYVVELRESGSPHAERFVRQVPHQAVGSLVELRIGGLRPSGPGRIYVAQVRSISACGCESEASPPAVSQPVGVMAAAQQQPQPQLQQQQPQVSLPTLSLAAACSPPAAQHSPVPSPPAELPEQSAKLAAWQNPAPSPTKASSFASGGPTGLPSLLQSSRAGPPVPPPVGSAPEVVGAVKEIAPEITANEECIILD